MSGNEPEGTHGELGRLWSQMESTEKVQHRQSRRKFIWIGLGALVIILIAGIAANGILSSKPKPKEFVLTRINFAQRPTGWFSGTSGTGARYAFSHGGYTIHPPAGFPIWSYAPIGNPVQKMTVDVFGSLGSKYANQTGMGATCIDWIDTPIRVYDFVAYNPGSYRIDRVVAGSLADNKDSTLAQGSLPSGVHLTPTDRVTGSCLTTEKSGIWSTDLALRLNGKVIKQLHHVDGKSRITGWTPGVAGFTTKNGGSVTFTHLVEHDGSPPTGHGGPPSGGNGN